MSDLRNRKKGCRACRLLCCLLLMALVLSQAAVPGYCESEPQSLNASGNWNTKPSFDPIGESEGFSAVLYNNRNGLPTSEANAIAQTGDGFIWIGSYSGLIRYDGNSFERFDSTSGVPNVRCLFVDSRDRLWIGTNDAGVFLLFRGEICRWDKSDGLESVSIRCITEAEDGTIYVCSSTGVGMIDDSLRYTAVQDARLNGQTVPEIRRGSDGQMIGVTYTGDIFVLKEGKLVFWMD